LGNKYRGRGFKKAGIKHLRTAGPVVGASNDLRGDNRIGCWGLLQQSDPFHYDQRVFFSYKKYKTVFILDRL
jgi:hypothetical protein